MSDSNGLYVWDPVVRISHWGLATGFFTAYLVEDDVLSLHVWAGYGVLALLLIRLVWGFIGGRYARFANFVQPPETVCRYLSDVLHRRASRCPGHNPAGGAMVVALMISVAGTVVSGIALWGAQELSGPLASLLSGTPPSWSHGLEDLHEVLADLTLLLVGLHLAGVLAASLQHHENLVKSMFTGYKRRQIP